MKEERCDNMLFYFIHIAANLHQNILHHHIVRSLCVDTGRGGYDICLSRVFRMSLAQWPAHQVVAGNAIMLRPEPNCTAMW